MRFPLKLGTNLQLSKWKLVRKESYLMMIKALKVLMLNQWWLSQKLKLYVMYFIFHTHLRVKVALVRNLNQRKL
jgi:hypothetical protein